MDIKSFFQITLNADQENVIQNFVITDPQLAYNSSFKKYLQAL